MTTTQDLLNDYTAALNLAVFDASRGDSRWLKELVAMAASKAARHKCPGFLKAAKAAAKAGAV